MTYAVWADGSDGLLRLCRDPSPGYWDDDQKGVGVRKGGASLLGYTLRRAVRGDLILTDNADIRELHSGGGVLPREEENMWSGAAVRRA